jgi:hypothetical protein
MSTLTIDLNQEYKIKIENGNEFHKSIFKEVYINAAKNVYEIIKQSDKSSLKNKYDYFNNIIAFTGERGKGKSSSMISFRDALVGNKKEKHKDFFENESLKDTNVKKEFEILRNKTFATIDIIDPSLFRGKESLFEIILAKMFSKFQTLITENKSVLKDDERRKLISQFQKVFDNLKIINTDRKDLYEQETIEALSKLATSSNLRDCFETLINLYLNSFDKKDFLIIAIDDFDLNLSGAYDMLEDIRQFLIQRNVIILIACKIHQLKEILNIHYSDLKSTDNNDNKADRYLDKLIPFSKRCSLPNISDVRNVEFEIINRNNEIIFNSKEEDIQNVILKFIFENNAIFITKDVYKFNSLIPKTLRELNELFTIIIEKDNLEQLKYYLLMQIEKENIYPEIFNDLEEKHNNYLNLYVVLTLKSLLKSLKEEEYRHNYFFKEFIIQVKESTNPKNVSLGDVLALIDYYKANVEIDDNKNNKFIDYINTYYAIRIANIPSREKLIGGFYNGSKKIFRLEASGKRRDWFEFEKSLADIKADLKKVDDLLIFSLFIYVTGSNHKIYRRENISPFYRNEFYFSKGIFSPISFLSNTMFLNDNFKTLNVDDYDDSSFIFELENWIDSNDLFVSLLSNQMFVSEFLNNINIYTEEYKVKLPDTYFKTISLYLVNGGIDSINKISQKHPYLGSNIINSYVTHPIIKLLCNYNIQQNSALIDEKLFNLDEIKNKKISSNVVDLVNEIYEKFDPSKNTVTRLNNEIKLKLEKLLKRIKSNPDYTVVTLSTIINEIKKIDKLHPYVDELNKFKPKINSKDIETIKQGKNELLEYLNFKING